MRSFECSNYQCSTWMQTDVSIMFGLRRRHARSVIAIMNIITERVYYTDTYLDQLKVKVLEVGQDEVGSYVICDKTIFHPPRGRSTERRKLFGKRR